MKVIFGVDVGGTSIKIGLLNEDKKLLLTESIKTNKKLNGKYVIDEIVLKIKEIMESKSLKETDLVGIGFGVPGPVVDNFIIWCPNIGWRNLYFEEEFLKVLGFPTKIKVTNDATAAAYGEFAHLKAEKNLAFITLGTGVGGGVVIDGKIVEGVNGSAGEFGHLQVVYENPTKCPCGLNGCLETVASIRGMKLVAEKVVDETIMPTKLTKEDLNPRTIFYWAKKEDLVALEVIDRVGDYIARAIAKIAVSVDPEVVVIGGGIANAGNIIIKAVKKHYKKYSYFGTKKIKIRLAKLKNNAGIYGAAELIFGLNEHASN